MDFSHRTAPPCNVGHQAFAEHDGIGQSIGAIPGPIVDRSDSRIGIKTLIRHDRKKTCPPWPCGAIGGSPIHIPRSNTPTIVPSVETICPGIHLVLGLLTIARANKNRYSVLTGFAELWIITHQGIGTWVAGRIGLRTQCVQLIEHHRLFNVRKDLTGPSVRIPNVVFSTKRILAIGALKVRASECQLPNVAHALRATGSLSGRLNSRQK